jgi:PAS domain S-box-containing protein
MLMENKTREELIEELNKLRSMIEQAKEIEDRFQKLSEASFEAILIHENGKILDVNQATSLLFGYNREELLNMTAFDLSVKEDREFIKELVKKRYQQPYEATGLRKDGTTFSGELSAKEFIYRDKAARVVAIRDISRRKNSEKQLHQVKEDYENLIKQSPDGIFILDEKGNILFANPSAHQILGIKSPDEIQGRSSFDFVLPQYCTPIKERFKLLRNGENIPFMKMEVVRIDGAIINVEYKSVLINYQGRKATLVVYHNIAFQEQLAMEKSRSKIAEETNYVLKKEIEERKKVETKLVKSEEQYKLQSAKLNSIIESSSHIVWTVDKNNVLTSFNQNFSRLVKESYGKRPSLKTMFNIDRAISKKAQDEFWNKKFKTVFSGTPQHFEAGFDRKSGVKVWFEIYLNPIYDENANVKEVSGIGHDITEKKDAESKIKQSLKEKEVLLKEVHHRVKNNLQVISSLLNLQSSYVSDKKVIELLKESQNRIKSMSFIHESLYQSDDFSKVKFATYIQHLTSNLLLSYNPKGKKISLKQKIDDVFLNLDLAIPCGLIINELVSNSLKYAFVKKGKGELVLSIKVDKKDNVKILITDNGSGLPREIDYRNTQSLGLQLVMVLVSQLKGTIKLDNKKGAKFAITFNKRNVN